MAEWSDARKRSFVVSGLRRTASRWPPKYAVLKSAFVGKKTNPSSGRICSFYTCASCGLDFPTKEVQVDHIEPVVDPEVGFVSWDEFISRLFVEEEKLQVLCTTCHDKKTKKERKIRASKKRN